MIRLPRAVLCSFAVMYLIGCAQKAPEPVAAPATPEGQPAAEATPVAKVEEVLPTYDNTPALEEPSADGQNRLKAEEVADGWIRLFDGATLFGWKSNSNLTWSVTDGVISAGSDKAEDKGLLVTTTRFANYELRCDYRVAKGGNTGIFLRTATNPADAAVDCYEFNMCDTHPEFATGSLVKRAQPLKQVQGDGEWHSIHLVLDGPHITAKFDGEPILDFTDGSETPLTTGHIGLQMNGGKAEFRNVYLKPIGMRSLFDGQTLEGWRPIPGAKSKFEVKDGTIHIADGPGYLETKIRAKNFVLQFDAIANGDSLNGGVFFRARPGNENKPAEGYEFQVQSGIKDGDRNKPADFGTGAIFRRAPARRVVSKDREWFTGTLIADEAHFSTWVNGIQVVDWVDTRPGDKNPRVGLKLDEGYFSLQGHDATTDIAFRNLRLVDTP